MTLSRSEVFLPLCIPQFQLLYVAPLQEQTRRYSDLYLTEAIRSCPLAQMLQSKSMAGKYSDAKIISATGHQTFANGAGIQLTYAKTSADRARGIMADMMLSPSRRSAMCCHSSSVMKGMKGWSSFSI